MLIAGGLCAALGYSGLCLAVSHWQTRLALFPVVGLDRTPTDVGLNFEEWILPSGSGQVVAWKISPRHGQVKHWLLHCHGNGGNIAGRLELAQALTEQGIGVVLFDYRGYGRSQGQIQAEADLFQDGQAVYNRMAELKQPVWIYGESLGGGVASYLAETNACAGLALQSTFTRFTDRAGEAYPFLPVRWLSRFQLNTQDRLARLHCPVLVMHGSKDEVIGFHHGQRLFAAAHQPKTWVELDRGHNDPSLELIATSVRKWMEAASAES